MTDSPVADKQHESCELTLASTNQEQEPKRVKAEPVRLDFFAMPGREPDWEVTSHGFVTVPPPIEVFPKPLALAYRNFNNHYGEHKSQEINSDGVTYPTRALVGSQLIGQILHHYFSEPQYKITCLGAEPQNLLDGVPVFGMLHWVVLKQTQTTQELDEGIGMDSSDDAKETQWGIHLIAAVTADQQFLQMSARTHPTQLSVARQYIRSNGILSLRDIETSCCSVVLLAGGIASTKPQFEFYSFDSVREAPGTLIPWFGQTEDVPYGLDTSIVTLAVEEAPKIDHMFKAIVSYTSRNRLVLPGNTSYDIQPQQLLPMPSQTPEATGKSLKAKGRPKPKTKAAQSKEKPRRVSKPVKEQKPVLQVELTEDYVRTVKVSKIGTLFEGTTGKMIPKDNARAIRLFAEEKGITLGSPKYTHAQYRKKTNKHLGASVIGREGDFASAAAK